MRDFHTAETHAMTAPDPSWAHDHEELVQDARFQQWDSFETAPERPWEEFSLEHNAAPADAPVYVRVEPVDDSFEQSVLLSLVGAFVVGGMCVGSALVGFVVGLFVAA